MGPLSMDVTEGNLCFPLLALVCQWWFYPEHSLLPQPDVF